MDKQVQIPYTYKWLAAGNKNLYVRYIKSYMNTYHPRLYPMKIMPRGENLPDIVICIKK